MKKTKTQKGITLVALIITIVVLLILAVVTINAIKGDGIVQYIANSTNYYKNSQIEEEEKLLHYEYQLEKAQGKITTTWGIYSMENQLKEIYGQNIKLGDKINYDCYNGVDSTKLTYTATDEKTGWTTTNSVGQTLTVTENPEWRVIGIENGQILITTASPVGEKFYLRGQKGIINGLDEFKKLTSIYGHGQYADEARCITMSDINKITGYNPKNTGTGKSYLNGKLKEYGNKITYSFTEDGTLIAYTSSNNNNGTSENSSCVYFDEKNRTFITLTKEDDPITLTNTFYNYYPTTLKTGDAGEVKGIEKTSNIYRVLFEQSYWISDRFITTYNYAAAFGFFYCNTSYISGAALYVASNISAKSRLRMKPVVKLKADINIISGENGWEINNK